VLGYHREAVHLKALSPPQPITAPVVARTEKFVRPKLTVNDGFVQEEDWDNSCKEYKMFAGPGAHAGCSTGLAQAPTATCLRVTSWGRRRNW
jgi:hypothetical protein